MPKLKTIPTINEAVEQLKHAIRHDLIQMLGGGSHTGNGVKANGTTGKGKRTMSAAARAKIAAAQRARWAKLKGKASSGRVRSMSATARAKIAAAARARWVKAKAAGKSRL